MLERYKVAGLLRKESWFSFPYQCANHSVTPQVSLDYSDLPTWNGFLSYNFSSGRISKAAVGPSVSKCAYDCIVSP